MIRTTLSFLLVLGALGMPDAAAQDPSVGEGLPEASSTLETEASPALAPFEARYEVLAGGKALGEATLQLTPLSPHRWRVDLDMGGRGLFRLAGINAEQSTVFEDTASGFLPLSQGTVRKTLFSRKQTTGTYDWARRSATWTGDIKESRERPVALEPGDMSGLLINLAVIRDARPGATLRYRYVDNGRAKPHVYRVSEEMEGVKVGELSYNAMRVTRSPDPGDAQDDEETVIWVAHGVPTPVRMLQREGGEDKYDLRLVDYTGVQ
ncbi:DUF3108 domain-containing protein [Marilutibacter aestuarii]|uniref:DUF3108 domain-containing protein n=1 Tax=Marilutibacter aestuarii TaxID=1706195 RepID=UPI001FEAF438|nr:DUF3108 domain-containing protein [Lysobacter aestuarii]